MKKTNSMIFIMLIFLFQSCLFGAGLVEREITDDYWLFANNEMHEMSIWHHSENRSGGELIVEETVFAIGYNDNFIIAKSHPKNSTNQLNLIEVLMAFVKQIRWTGLFHCCYGYSVLVNTLICRVYCCVDNVLT